MILRRTAAEELQVCEGPAAFMQPFATNLFVTFPVGNRWLSVTGGCQLQVVVSCPDGGIPVDGRRAVHRDVSARGASDMKEEDVKVVHVHGGQVRTPNALQIPNMQNKKYKGDKGGNILLVYYAYNPTKV